MKPDEARALYGPAYAARYEELWQRHDLWQAEAGHYVRSLGELIEPDTKWLDVGCGTGWFLSQFPGIERGGLDLSPSMLEKARANNPDAAFFREGDIRVDVPEWHDRFDLVSSTGQAWGYVDSIRDVEKAAENMARWTAPDGVLYVQPPDLFDLVGHQLTYDFSTDTPPDNTVRITGAIWSYYDEAGEHQDQVWPSLDVWVKWLSRWFRLVEVHTWPHEPAEILHGPRRLVLARHKRAEGDDEPAEIVVHPAPVDERAAASASASADVAEQSAPVSADHGAGAEQHVVEAAPAPEPEQPQVDSDQPAAVVPGPGERLPDRSLVDQPLSYLLSRVRPVDPRFWRSQARRVRRKLR